MFLLPPQQTAMNEWKTGSGWRRHILRDERASICVVRYELAKSGMNIGLNRPKHPRNINISSVIRRNQTIRSVKKTSRITAANHRELFCQTLMLRHQNISFTQVSLLTAMFTFRPTLMGNLIGLQLQVESNLSRFTSSYFKTAVSYFLC